MSDAEAMQQTVAEIVAWQRETFPDATVDSQLRHLRREVEEALEASVGPHKAEEVIDCLFLVIGALDHLGLIWNAVQILLDWKLGKNRERTWKAPDAEGVVEHLEES